jgi:predicted outer membrane repeat protein
MNRNALPPRNAPSPLLSCLVVLATIAYAQAATIEVTVPADSGPGSLRAAIASAHNGDTITFLLPLPSKITLTSGELLVTNSVDIIGPGNRLVLDGNAASRVFHILGATGTIANLTISNGLAVSAFSAKGGGGILNEHGTLTLSNVVLSGNSAEFGAGIYNDGCCIGGTATLTVINSVLNGNSATGSGGAIYNSGYIGIGRISIVTSTVRDNAARFGGALFNDAYSGHTRLGIMNSTLSGNWARHSGGAIYNEGETSASLGVYPNGANLILINSTLSGNSANTNGGAVYNVGEPDHFFPGGGATLTVLNSTMSDNSAGVGGGAIYNDGVPGQSIVEVGSSIFEAGESGENIFNDSGRVSSYGYNLSSDDAGGFFASTGDLVNTEPMLGSLQDNGGPTFTHAPLCGSPAIDQGKTFSDSATDQRGGARTVDDPVLPNAAGGDATDIGACEIQDICTVCDAIQLIVELVGAAGLGQHAHPLVGSLKSACEAFDRGATLAGINQLQAFRNKIRAQVAPTNPGLSGQLDGLARQLIDGVTAHREMGP